VTQVPNASNVVLMTRFSLLRRRCGDRGAQASRPNADFEALSLLAEALECLSMVLLERHPDAAFGARVADLKRRTSLLEGAIRETTVSRAAQ
jgi:hypothetical protein